MNASDLEPVLCDCYERERVCYARALEVGERIGILVDRGVSAEDELQVLDGCMKEVAAIEAEMKEIKALWQQSGRSPGARLQQALATVASLIQRLSACLARAEEEGRARLGRLGPQLDDVIRARHMRQAYAVHMTRGKRS